MKTFKKYPAVIWMVVISSMVLSACTGTFTIMSDYDKSADFSKFHTYNYVPNSDSLMGPGAARIKSYMEEYMELLGYKKSATPDLYISLNGNVQQKTGVTSSGYSGYGYYGWDSYTTTCVYNTTTIVIDLVDVKKHQLVWQGAANGEFDQYSMKDSKMHQMIDEIFGQYPYTAGSNVQRQRLYNKYYKKPEPAK